MTRFRRFLFGHRALAAWVIALALLLKVAVPAGYMIGEAGGSPAIMLCDGHSPMQAMPNMAHGGDKRHDAAKDMPCAASSMASASLAAVEPVLLALALAFLLATVFRIETESVARAPARLRPPLRGPPLPA